MNKPVAWTDGKGNYFDKNSFFPVDDLIPLYTHPVKEQDESFDRTASHMAGEYVSYQKELALTDEEMISIYEKDWSGIKCGLGRAVEQAILRKASEK